MMKQIMKNAIMMEGTVADHASTLIFVQIALAFQMFGHGFKPSEQSYRYKV